MFSGHAYGTIEENIQYAKKAGLDMIAITDHGPKMPGGPHKFYFHNFHSIPREIDGIQVLMGIEANIMSYDGILDLDEKRLKKMDLVIASLHEKCIPFGSMEENTQAVIQVAKNPDVDILGHLDDPRYPIDVEAVVRVAKETGTWIELNNASFHFDNARYQVGHHCLSNIMRECQKQNAMITIGSDAHYPSLIGGFSKAVNFLKSLGFKKELIVNTNKELFIQKMVEK